MDLKFELNGTLEATIHKKSSGRLQRRGLRGRPRVYKINSWRSYMLSTMEADFVAAS